MKEMMLFLLLLLTVPVAAQSDWHEALREWLTAEDVEESYGEELLEQLEERAQTPINLNQTCREELEELPFLTAQQVEELTEYLDHYKPMRSLSELQMVKGLDYHTRRLLQCFVVAGEERKSSVWPKAADLLKYGQHRMTATGKIPFYERQGDRNGYLGYKYRHDLRYQYTFGNRIKAGITAAQDAGEPFFTNKNSMGYDQYNYYVQLRDFGRLEELNLGHYRVQMGMGLVMNTSFHLGKLTTLQTMGRGLHTLSAHSSRSASNHLQGIAATVRLAKQWRVMAFASYQAIDATLNDDGTARTLLYSGYHRTPTEIEKKHNTYETDLGASIGWHQGTLHINANAVYTRYDRSLQPMQNALYHTYSAQGNSFNSFREGSSIQNEHGIYLGATWQPLRSWFVQGYVDYAHFSWPRYQVSASSDAFDALFSARYSRKRWKWNMRYRMHIRQHDNDTKKLIVNQTSHRLRIAVDWTATSTLTLRTDGVVMSEQGTNSRGIMIGQQARWQQRWLKVTGTVAWFHSDDYDSRLYQYEPSTQYDFSFPAYYGHGIRYSLMMQADIGKHLALATKLGVTNYFDRSVIGTGQSSMADLLMQLNVKL